MVAPRYSQEFVPIHLLIGASCLWPAPRWLQTAAATSARSTVAGLTPTEERVLSLLLAGLSNKEIASELGRAEATVKNQVASILRKQRVPSRARLMAQIRGYAPQGWTP